ncbi:Acetyltransferase, GNAT family [Aphelenchoides fujianensis]|nr:Acetyltransferase, GNAT family [Aphelenchoides fujianensis]
MDRFDVLTNPGQELWEKIVENVSLNEGWASANTDLAFFHDAFPGNFTLYVAVDKETGELAGSVSVATYAQPEPLSMLGMYAVVPKFKGQGIGTALWAKAMEICAPRMFLYGAEAMREKYARKWGFDKIPDWKALTSRTLIRKVFPLLLHHDPTLHWRKPEEVGWEAIEKYYKKFLKDVDGSQAIRAMLQVPGAESLVMRTNEDRIVALVRVREAYGKTLVVGPLLGNDDIAATSALRQVLCNLLTLREFKHFVIQYPSTCTETRKMMDVMCKSDYTTDVVATYPQWTERVFDLPVQHVYALSQSDVAIV